MSSNPTPTPLILSIPNEILHHILSFLPDLSHSQPFIQFQLNGEDYEASQMLVLRSVCRLFRAITAELDFWYDADFSFADLVSSSEHDLFVRHDQEERFLRVLFTDASLVESLGRRKTDWMFESLEGLMAVMEGVPLFIQNARTIYLEIMEDDEMLNSDIELSSLDIAIDTLAECSQITTLNIRLADTVHLIAIATSFPSLENLSCTETNHFHGSLQKLSRLQSLHIHIHTPGDDELTHPLLPLRSAETLTRLNLSGIDFPFFDAEPLDAFINLKSLNIGPLCDSICDFIVRARIQLDVFETELLKQHAPIDIFVNMLRAESLRHLKEFGLSNWHEDNSDRHATERYWSLVIDAFTSMLPSVEEVQLDAPLHLKCCRHFARMVNLKILNWDGSPYPYFGCGTTKNPKPKIERALGAAFANFMEKPQFAVHYLGGFS